MLFRFVFGVTLIFSKDSSAIISNLGYYIGIIGTVMCIIYIIINRKLFKSNELEEEEHKLDSLKETLIHGAVDVAFVTTWVFIAFLIFEFSVYFIGGESAIETWLITAGIMTVISGALLGLIPGSGPQIISLLFMEEV